MNFDYLVVAVQCPVKREIRKRRRGTDSRQPRVAAHSLHRSGQFATGKKKKKKVVIQM